jgi:hypothetical protein
MAIVLTHFGSGSNKDGSTVTMSGTIPAGSLIVFVASEAGGATSPTDSAGNTWHLVGGTAVPLGGFVGFTQIQYVYNSLAITAGSITWTPSSAAGGACSVFYATGVQTSADPVDAATLGTNFGTGSTPTAVMAAAPAVAGSLVVAVIGIQGPVEDTYSQGAGFTAPPNKAGSTGGLATSNYTVGGGTTISSALLTYAPTITSEPWGAEIVAFKPAAVGGTVWSGSARLAGAGTVLTSSAIRTLRAASARLAGVGLATAIPRAVIHIRPLSLTGLGSVFAFIAPPPLTAITPVVLPPPAPRAIDPYLALIPDYNAVQPNFMAVLAATMQPLVDLQSFLSGLPEQFDLDTAIGAQLDIVGIWIGKSRQLSLPISNVYFSWDTPGLGWEQGSWQGAFDPADALANLDDGTYRQVLYAKVGSNHWDGTITGIVDILTALFGSQGVTITVVDGQDMTMTVTVTGTINSVIFKALLTGGQIPIKPEGVTINYVLS